MKRIIFLLSLSIASNIFFAQSFIHPGKFGVGYIVGYASGNEFSSFLQSVYLSTGNLDLAASFANSKVQNNNVYSNSLFVGYTFCKKDSKYFPSIGLSINNLDKSMDMGIGISLAILATDKTYLKIKPEFGLMILTRGSNKKDFIDWLMNNAVLDAELNFCIEINKYMTLNLSPGMEIVFHATNFVAACGISIVP
jgi:hypothetical protein